MRKFFLVLTIILCLTSCKKEKRNQVDLSEIKVDFNMDRFEQDFYTTSIEDLSKLKRKYPLFFPKNISDSIWTQKMEDKDEQELYLETQKVYRDIENLKEELTLLFQHIKYYFPEFEVPNVTTVISNIDYNYRIIYNQKNLIISLDAYLGKNHPFYADFPSYIKENNKRESIVVDVAKEISKQFMPKRNERTLLGKMIYEGKKQYLLDFFLPDVSDQLKIGYSKEKLNWANVNEEQIWKYFIEKNILYSTESELDTRFLDLAPFSKFYLSLDNESPGQIGVWLGWQIVRSLMEKNDVSLQTLLNMNSQDVLKKSKYKPRS